MPHVNPMLLPSPLGDAQDLVRRQVFGPRDPRWALQPTGVTAGQYGSGTQVPQITVGADGRVTAASSVAITADEASLHLAQRALLPHAPAAVTEAQQVLRDTTHNDVSTARHGYTPKLPNDSTLFLNGVGGYAVPSGVLDLAGLTLADPAFDDSAPFYDLSATANRRATLDRAFALVRTDPGHRLTLLQGDPTGSNSAVSTVYYCPYKHDLICLWDGTRWVWTQVPEIALVLSGLTSGRGHDVFAFTSTATPSSTDTGTDTLTFGSATGWQTGSLVRAATTGGGLTAGTDYWYGAVTSTTGRLYASLANALAGTPVVNLTASITSALTAVSLETLVWTSATARATAVTLQDGRYCKSGDKTRLLTGAFGAVSTSTTEDRATNTGRKLWNAYNRVPRTLEGPLEGTDSWTYASSAWRQWNNSAASKVEVFQGLIEDTVALFFFAGWDGNGAIAIGLDSTSAYSGLAGYANITGQIQSVSLPWIGLPGLGLHTLNLLEYRNAGTVTFYGDAGVPSFVQYGARGWMMG